MNKKSKFTRIVPRPTKSRPIMLTQESVNAALNLFVNDDWENTVLVGRAVYGGGTDTEQAYRILREFLDGDWKFSELPESDIVENK